MRSRCALPMFLLTLRLTSSSMTVWQATDVRPERESLNQSAEVAGNWQRICKTTLDYLSNMYSTKDARALNRARESFKQSAREI